MLIKL